MFTRLTGTHGRGRMNGRVARVAIATVAGFVLASCVGSQATGGTTSKAMHWGFGKTSTPIQHLVVLFDENISFDHYFGTYPNATNTDGTPFTATPNTPVVNGLTPTLLTHNPNTYNPKRLSGKQALTCDQNHDYTPEQKAVDGGKMDKFVQETEQDMCTGQPILFGEPGLVMDYYDGNTVTALWNYAQHYALNDNSYGDQFGPSTPGAINLVAGQTHGASSINPATGQPVVPPDSSSVGSPDADGVGTVYSDPDPAYDDCSDSSHTDSDDLAAMHGRNIGDLLTGAAITWGWFQGGFRPTGTAHGYAVCGTKHSNIGGVAENDYSPHHNPFSYYPSTANPKHLPPSSAQLIGQQDQANHNYDLTDFNTALANGNLPAVSFLKAAEYQDGHAGYSDPLDEQTFLVTEINAIEHSADWPNTAIVIAYDDSDGWYDHQAPTIINGSTDSSLDTAICTSKPPTQGGYADRCGVGPRMPLLVLSPYSKANYVDHTNTDQSSITAFIEQNWQLGQLGDGSYDATASSMSPMFDFTARPNVTPLILDPKTGAIVSG